jgi:hypothetical protein
MRSAVAWSFIAGLVATAAPLHAQRVEAGVVVRSGPVAGHVVIRVGYSTYRRPPARRVVVVERPRIVAVERVHRHRSHKHWVRRGYRPVTLYYWDGRYYDRRVGHRHGVRTIVVWERDGRFYHDCDDERRWDD